MTGFAPLDHPRLARFLVGSVEPTQGNPNERRHGRATRQVSIVSINRPEKLNAINKAVAIELQQAFAAFDRSSQRVAILTGAGGRAFSAGADVTDLPELWRCVPTVGIA